MVDRSMARLAGIVVGVGLGLIVATGVRAGESGYLGVLVGGGEGDTAEVQGAHVAKVVPEGPAAKAGLQDKDVITAINGSTIRGPEDVVRMVRAAGAGDTMQLEVRRGEETVKVEVTLGTLPVDEGAAGQHGEGSTAPPAHQRDAASGAFLGVGLGPVHPAVVAHLGLEEGAGIMVGDVYKDSPAEKAGIEANDVLLSIDGSKIEGPESLVSHLAGRKPGDAAKIELIHKGTRSTVDVVLGKRPGDVPAGGFRHSMPFGPGGRLVLPYPERGQRGRIIIESPEGSKQYFNLPGEAWKLDDFMKEMESQFPELWKLDDGGKMSERMRKLFETLKDGGSEAEWSSGSHATAVVRIVDGDYDVTVRDEDGSRTVDVKKGDQVLAEKLPYDKIDTLPEDARAAVEKAAKGIRVEVHSVPAPAPAKPSEEGELKA